MKLVLIGAALVEALAVADPAAAKVSYCSPTGDYCTSVAKLKGVRYLRISTFSFTGRVKICVRAECRYVNTPSTNGELAERASSSGR